MLQATKWNLLWPGTARTTGSTRISVSTHCQSTAEHSEVVDDPDPLPRCPLEALCLLKYSWSEMEKYCLENNIPFKILLIVDNARDSLLLLWSSSQYHSDVSTSDTTSLIQAMNQVVIIAFNTYYLKNNLCLGYCRNWEKHWEDTDAIFESLQHLWLHQAPCLVLEWYHQSV